MCALGNSSVETKTHKGLKEDEKTYLTSALQYRQFWHVVQHSDFSTSSIKILLGSLKTAGLLYKKNVLNAQNLKYIWVLMLEIYQDWKQAKPWHTW